ncbi:MAG: AmmeMemoRadiSam system radical SAM enzyme [Candidatus Bathyarchaeota archaeon]|nr:AmmeMemoRadiSam system radical SAM enzyme [Candidatus Termiticorpusculum sp.]
MSTPIAMLYTQEAERSVKCCLCARRCLIKDGSTGFCLVRKNKDGILYALNYGKIVSFGVDPIGKKPLSHFNPGALVASIAAAGCNFRCQFCDNWMISQSTDVTGNLLSPEDIIKSAKEANCHGISYTYTEPTIFMEYAYNTAKLAHEAGLFNTFVTNGYLTPEAVKTIAPYIDAVTIDFKAAGDSGFYKNISTVSEVQPIFEAIKEFKLANIHIEITNLIIPKIGDSMSKIACLAKWINDYLGPNTPFHLLRFHPDYKMSTLPATSLETMEHAYLVSKSEGLRYVYLGNMPGHVAENTYCPACNELIIQRDTYEITQWHLTNEMQCNYCKNQIPIKGKYYPPPPLSNVQTEI